VQRGGSRAPRRCLDGITRSPSLFVDVPGTALQKVHGAQAREAMKETCSSVVPLGTRSRWVASPCVTTDASADVRLRLSMLRTITLISGRTFAEAGSRESVIILRR
jgi:hypothetical protein